MYGESSGARTGGDNRSDKRPLKGSRSDFFADSAQGGHVLVQMNNNDAEAFRQKLVQLRGIDFALRHPPVRWDRERLFCDANVIGALVGIIPRFDHAPKRRPAE